MGAVISVEGDEIKENVLLKRLAGSEAISDNDPYWNKLFSFNFNIPLTNREAQRNFSETVSEFLQCLLYNTSTTNNFGNLIQVFLRRSSELDASVKCQNKIFLWQLTNALLIIRHICVFFAQRLSATEFVNIFERRINTLKDSLHNEDFENSIGDSLASEFLRADELGEDFGNSAEAFLGALVDILVEVPINEFTLPIHHETIRVALSLLSSQLYEYNVTEKSQFLKYFMQMRKSRATNLVRVLLENFIGQNKEVTDSGTDSKPESLVISFATSMWSAFQKTVMIPSSFDDEESPLDELESIDSLKFPPQTLGNLSASLLLSLVCYTEFEQKQNVYKQMLSLFQNAQEVSSLANLEASFKLDFTALYNRLCQGVQDKIGMLLLYMLLHKNSGFRNFILSRINLENLVLPIIQVLNEGISKLHSNTNSSSHQTYLALIVLLVLSEDDFFCKIIHETKLKNINWYQPERPIHEISLGGLIVLVFIRTIHTNTVKTRDRYLHTNSLAALANMASYFKHLAPLVCQKLIALLETMTRRHGKLIQRMRDNTSKHNIVKSEEDDESAEQNSQKSAETTEINETENAQNCELNESLHRDITALEEGIRNVLEIVNACLCNNLRYNADLIYSILYKRDLFEMYHNHPMFNDLVWNIYMVINHFTSKVEILNVSSSLNNPTNSTNNGTPAPTTPTTANPPSVSTVLEVIRKAAIEWPTDRLKKCPELKFKYIEDENTVDFFVPYVWRLIWQTCAIYFASPSLIKLFSLPIREGSQTTQLPSQESAEGCSTETPRPN